MSVSRIRELDALRFSIATFALFTTWVKRFCSAPRVAREDDTFWRAASIDVRSVAVLADVVRSTAAVPRSVELNPLVAVPLSTVTAIVSPPA